MMFVAGRLIFGGAGSITINKAVVSELEIELATFEVELPELVEVELPDELVVELPESPEVEVT